MNEKQGGSLKKTPLKEKTDLIVIALLEKVLLNQAQIKFDLNVQGNRDDRAIEDHINLHEMFLDELLKIMENFINFESRLGEDKTYLATVNQPINRSRNSMESSGNIAATFWALTGNVLETYLQRYYSTHQDIFPVVLTLRQHSYHEI
ncbi:hypothetical protein TKK_0005528 [Trichogramma kaykai]